MKKNFIEDPIDDSVSSIGEIFEWNQYVIDCANCIVDYAKDKKDESIFADIDFACAESPFESLSYTFSSPENKDLMLKNNMIERVFLNGKYMYAITYKGSYIQSAIELIREGAFEDRI